MRKKQVENKKSWGHRLMTRSTCLSICPLRAFLYRASDHSSGQRSAANWQHTHTRSHAPQSLASLSHSTPRTFHYPQHSHKYHPPSLLHTQTHSKISTQPCSAKWVPPVYTTTCVLWILLHHKHVEKLFITNTGPVVNVGVSCVRWLDLLT